MPDLSERFMETDAKSIDVDGRTVVQLYEREVTAGATIDVEFLRTAVDRVQGLNLSLTDGTLEVNQERIRDVVLYTDTAPRHVRLICHTEGPVTAQVWNSWRAESGEDRDDAWIGEAGIVVDDQGPQGVLLRCSDGIGPLDFGDLVVRLRFVP
jgi:hypothetical protein